MNNQSIHETVKRTQRSWFEDGLWDLGFACLCLLIGVYYYLIEALQLETRLGMLIPLIQLGIILLAFWGMGKGIAYLKQRITHPRIGYATFRKNPSTQSRWARALRGMLVGVVVGGVAGLIASNPSTEYLMPIIMCVIFGVLAVWLGFRFGLLRFHIIGAACVAMGFIIPTLHLNMTLAMSAVFIGEAIIWMISGALTLAIFLQNTTLHKPEEQMLDAGHSIEEE